MPCLVHNSATARWPAHNAAIAKKKNTYQQGRFRKAKCSGDPRAPRHGGARGAEAAPRSRVDSARRRRSSDSAARGKNPKRRRRGDRPCRAAALGCRGCRGGSAAPDPPQPIDRRAAAPAGITSRNRPAAAGRWPRGQALAARPLAAESARPRSAGTGREPGAGVPPSTARARGGRPRP